jgi:hypothetical protein
MTRSTSRRLASSTESKSGRSSRTRPSSSPVARPVAAADLQPVQERVAVAAPDRRGGGGRRRAPDARGRQLGARERVEQRRLAGARRPGERDHGRLDAEPQALARPADDRVGRVDRPGIQARAGEVGGVVEGREALVEGAAHRVRSSSASASASRGRCPTAAPPRRAGPRSAWPRGRAGGRRARAGPPAPARPGSARPGRRRSPRAPAGSPRRCLPPRRPRPR